jgi:hypothetical protein
MNNDEKKIEKTDDPVNEALQNIPKVSKIIFDAKTGTVTLQISKEQVTIALLFVMWVFTFRQTG